MKGRTVKLPLSTLMLAVVAIAGAPAVAQTCAPTAITPYVNVNGTWTQTSSATLKTGQVTYRPGRPTGALPGGLVRGAQAAPAGEE